MATISETGLAIERLETILENTVTQIKAIDGNADLDLSQDTRDGQILGIVSKFKADFEEAIALIYNAFDPATAIGVDLRRLIKLNGLTAQYAVESSVDITVTADRSLTLFDGFRVKDTTNNIWVNIGDKSLISGVNTVTFLAQEYGAIVASAGSITQTVDVILGIVSVNNTLDAVVGKDDESDYSLRVRQTQSTEKPSRSMLAGIASNVLNLSGVVEVKAYENETNIQDVVRDMTPHSIWVVVEGGEVEDIANEILLQKTGGAYTKGEIETTILETIGDMQSPAVIRFDRPTEIPLYVKLTATKKNPSDVVDSQAIKNALVALSFKINAEVVATSLYSAIYSAGSNFVATDLEISDDDITYVTSSLTSGYDERFLILYANIDITVL